MFNSSRTAAGNDAQPDVPVPTEIPSIDASADVTSAPDTPSGARDDPYLRPNTPLRIRLRRALWHVAYLLLFRPSPRPLHAWRALVLRTFGATIGDNPRIYAKASIWAPWNLHCEDCVAIADGAIVYNPAPVHLGSHCALSQESFLCGATHDYDDRAFPQIALPIQVGPYGWICARATVLPGVNVGEGAVLGLGSIATRDLEPWGVYAGNPARKVRERRVGQRTQHFER